MLPIQKSSRIILEYAGVNLNAEKDWPAMIAFQLKWSQRFYDSFCRRILQKR